MKDFIIFCDFDGTITLNDTVDEFLNQYANNEWLDIEAKWLNGEIGSKQCIVEQFNQIRKIESKDISYFVDIVEVDPYFCSFLEEIRAKGIDFYIVSDGFRPLIERILEKHGISGCRIFSNDFYHTGNNKIVPFFPFNNMLCKSQAGLCKCSIVKELGAGRKIIYIGDGQSDKCVCTKADILFAKNSLAKHCREKGIKHFSFKNFKEITDCFFGKEIFNAGREAAYR